MRDTSLAPSPAPRDVRARHERMERVYHPPVPVRAFTSKRFTYPEWDMSGCHAVDRRFPLVDHPVAGLGLHAELDSTLFMETTPRTWGASWLYREAPPAAPPARR